MHELVFKRTLPQQLAVYKLTMVHVTPVSGKVRSVVLQAYGESDARQIAAERYGDQQWRDDQKVACMPLGGGSKSVVMEATWP